MGSVFYIFKVESFRHIWYNEPCGVLHVCRELHKAKPSRSQRRRGILTALHNCGLESEYNCLQDAMKLSKQIDPEELDENLIGEEWEKIDSSIALNNNYDKFWDKVREYITQNLDY